MRAYKTICLSALIGLFASGCYELNEPIIDKGSRAGIAGSFQCANQMDGKRGAETIKEVSSGFFFKDYKYILADGTEIHTETIKDKFHVAQTKNKQKLNVVFFDVNDNGFTAMIPNMMTQLSTIDLLANKYGVKFSEKSLGTLAIHGDKGKILEFLKAHNSGMMTTVMTCVKA